MSKVRLFSASFLNPIFWSIKVFSFWISILSYFWLSIGLSCFRWVITLLDLISSKSPLLICFGVISFRTPNYLKLWIFLILSPTYGFFSSIFIYFFYVSTLASYVVSFILSMSLNFAVFLSIKLPKLSRSKYFMTLR